MNLTKSQITMLEFAARGYNNRQIANILEKSERTVKNWFTLLYKQMKVKNRAQAVAVAIREGWI